MVQVPQIVVVDPDPASRRLLQDFLQKEGLGAAIALVESSSAAEIMPVLHIGQYSGSAQAMKEADYFSKPLRVGALLDRVRRYLETTTNPRTTERVGTYSVDAAENLLSNENINTRVRLTDKEKDLILLLMGAGISGCTRQDLLSQVWGYAENVETHTLETHVYRLRQKLIAAGFPAEFIVKTEQGYRIDAEV